MPSCLFLLAAALAAPAQPPQRRSTTTTVEAIAEYVYACMKVNGETHRCSMCCSIDIVASAPCDRYVKRAFSG